MTVHVEAISKRFHARGHEVLALDDISFTIAPQEFVCLVGPSGCGKTTLLKIVAGLVEPSAGAVRFPGAGGRQRTALVFQDHGLFPWLSVVDNMAFPLECAGVGREERRLRAREAAANVGLAGFGEAFPHELSGGMRQRVGIARALLADPDLLLMDEPFGALDAQTRLLLQDDLLAIWQRNRKQVLYVTHDIEEAVRLGDRVLVLTGSPGRIVEDVPVAMPRPRPPLFERSQDAIAIERHVWALLEQDVRGRLGAL